MNQNDPQETPEESIVIENSKKPRKLFLVGVVGLFLFIALLIFFFFNNTKKAEITNPVGDKTKQQEKAQITPFPFQEMTIPYLRSREFKSKLGPLEQIAENSSYTTYLTNYDSEGFSVNGLLTVPIEAKSALLGPDGGFPAIVFVHGYVPPASYSTQTRYVDHVDYLAKNGFIVFKIDLRGHGNSEGEAGGGYYSSDYVIDVLNAKAALEDYEIVDEGKIGLWGHSMAGNIIARAMAASPDISAISIWAGAVYTYSDFSDYEIEDNSYQPPSQDSPVRRRRDELFALYGSFDPNNEFWRQVPMTNYLDQVNGAIQINHAVNDDVVDIGYSRNFASILDKNQIKHELNEYPSGGHNINGTAFVAAMENTVRFFKENL